MKATIAVVFLSFSISVSATDGNKETLLVCKGRVSEYPAGSSVETAPLSESVSLRISGDTVHMSGTQPTKISQNSLMTLVWSIAFKDGSKWQYNLDKVSGELLRIEQKSDGWSAMRYWACQSVDKPVVQ